ncbi:MAG: hypothetical protein ACKOPP_06270 [Bacteroidota bacterium]
MHPKPATVSETLEESRTGSHPNWRLWYAILALFWLAFVGLLIYLTVLGG